MNRRLTLILTVSLASIALLSRASLAQSRSSENTLRLDDPQKEVTASIDDLKWLAGYWRGKGLGGICEEYWSLPLGNQMIGSFRLVKDGNTVFSEALVIVSENNRLVLKVKHFTPEFVGWEEKEDAVEFPLVRIGKQEVFFNGLTLRKIAKDKLMIYLVLKSQEGVAREEVFEFERVKLM